ncbi:nitrogen fixation protein NifQ [Mesorhizobium temperatum]|uniref:Nitrogen fixation protein NifQ n=1 Tax=Mesorhizobium temperatum TaxID=241416 RepID=A0A271LPF5_9HYPH|nr:nitrogen fixation protein NifQ [Mesorhizobium temperatum]
MVVDHAGCIGCGACARVCPKNCQTHVAADKVAACWRTNQENATIFANHNCRFSACQWPRIELERRFDQHVLACVLSRALEEVEAGEATATEATGLSRAELRDVLPRGFPAAAVNAFALEEVSDPEPDMEEELLRGLLLAHARPGDPASARFAKIVARRAMRNDHLWQDLGLLNRAELSRLLATHFPTLAAGNTQNMRWKKYFYRKLCEAEGFSLCTAPNCRQCNDFESCFGPEEGESRLMRVKNGIALD